MGWHIIVIVGSPTEVPSNSMNSIDSDQKILGGITFVGRHYRRDRPKERKWNQREKRKEHFYAVSCWEVAWCAIFRIKKFQREMAVVEIFRLLRNNFTFMYQIKKQTFSSTDFLGLIT
jgi:hypothetical protein